MKSIIQAKAFLHCHSNEWLFYVSFYGLMKGCFT
nr:MAG TPA: tachykinin family protein [Caudoviricetes sp.]DAM03529.1 MAG TPA: tachykinin family protein [Caudoviricetes sp.]DAM07738.1 MAG TPA: tachykinin family protein [Caudoviricetes sp.]